VLARYGGQRGHVLTQWRVLTLSAVIVAAVPASALAQDGPRFCPNQPSLESSACTTELGRVHLEISAIDWQLDKGGDTRTDTIVAGDLLVRAGIGPSTELQFGWSPVGRVREREAGQVTRRTRVGDVTLGIRHAFAGADGTGLSYGIQPFVTLPVGRTPVGAGTWGAGVVLPVTYDVADGVTVGFTGELDAQPDEDGTGRHFATNGVAGVAVGVTDTFSLTFEGQVVRDDDPQGATTQAFAATGVLWKVAPTRAFYAEAIAGLNRDSPDLHVYAGAAFLF